MNFLSFIANWCIEFFWFFTWSWYSKNADKRKKSFWQTSFSGIYEAKSPQIGLEWRFPLFKDLGKYKNFWMGASFLGPGHVSVPGWSTTHYYGSLILIVYCVQHAQNVHMKNFEKTKSNFFQENIQTIINAVMKLIIKLLESLKIHQTLT